MLFVVGQFLIGPSLKKSRYPGRNGIINQPDLSAAMEDKLKAWPEMLTWNAGLLRLHYSVFILGAYLLPIPEALRSLGVFQFAVSQ